MAKSDLTGENLVASRPNKKKRSASAAKVAVGKAGKDVSRAGWPFATCRRAREILAESSPDLRFRAVTRVIRPQLAVGSRRPARTKAAKAAVQRNT